MLIAWEGVTPSCSRIFSAAFLSFFVVRARIMESLFGIVSESNEDKKCCSYIVPQKGYIFKCLYKSTLNCTPWGSEERIAETGAETEAEDCGGGVRCCTRAATPSAFC